MANKGLFCQIIVIPLFKDHKILSQVAGHGIHTIKLLPPLIITDSDCDWIETLVRRRDRRCASRSRRRLVARQDAGRQRDARARGRLADDRHAGSVIAASHWRSGFISIAGRGAFWRASVRDDSGPASGAPHPCRALSRSCPHATRPSHRRKPSVALCPGLSRAPSVLSWSMTRAVTARPTSATSDRGTDAGAGPTDDRFRPAAAGHWTGKVWAMKQGVDHADRLAHPPRYLLFTDADIAYAPDALRRLVARAEAGGLVLTSLMAKLRCESFAERALIPAFVFFFQMLYPFAWVNRRDCGTAAAAGGCMLVRRDALRAAGGIEAISDALIDDCALGRKLKSVGPIWLGLTERVRSLRAYPHVSDIRRMVSRSAYDQLHYSPLLLAGTIAGMTLIYLVPPFFSMFGTGLSRALGVVGLGADGFGLSAYPALLSLVAVLGLGAAGNRIRLHGFHARFGLSAPARKGRTLEGAGSGECVRQPMTTMTDISPTKTHRGREFSGCVRAHSSAASRNHSCILPVCAGLRRHRGSSLAAGKRKARTIAAHGGHLARARRYRRRGDSVARCVGKARACAPPRAGPADCLSHGRHQAPVSGLGRSDRLLHLFGDAGRPFRARRPWRKPRDLARK